MFGEIRPATRGPYTMLPGSTVLPESNSCVTAPNGYVKASRQQQLSIEDLEGT